MSCAVLPAVLGSQLPSQGRTGQRSASVWAYVATHRTFSCADKPKDQRVAQGTIMVGQTATGVVSGALLELSSSWAPLVGFQL